MAPRPKAALDDDWLLGLKAMAAYHGVHPTTIQRWINRQAYPAGPLPGGMWIVAKPMVWRWIAQRGEMKIEERAAKRARSRRHRPAEAPPADNVSGSGPVQGATG